MGTDLMAKQKYLYIVAIIEAICFDPMIFAFL